MINRSAKNISNSHWFIGEIKSLGLGNPILERHFTTPYKVLISCLISLRTKDEVSDLASERLFQEAQTPAEMLKLSTTIIAKLIYPAGFYKRKSEQILNISKILLAKHQGQVPNELTKLLALPGVGLKTANLVLAQGFKIPAICVDIHVHRIMNRIGYVKTLSPEQTESQLKQLLPRNQWLIINSLLVNFGREICKPISPWCSKCPLSISCPKIGISKFR